MDKISFVLTNENKERMDALGATHYCCVRDNNPCKLEDATCINFFSAGEMLDKISETLNHFELIDAIKPLLKVASLSKDGFDEEGVCTKVALAELKPLVFD